MVPFLNSFEFLEIKVNDVTKTQYRNALLIITKYF